MAAFVLVASGGALECRTVLCPLRRWDGPQYGAGPRRRRKQRVVLRSTRCGNRRRSRAAMRAPGCRLDAVGYPVVGVIGRIFLSAVWVRVLGSGRASVGGRYLLARTLRHGPAFGAQTLGGRGCTHGAANSAASPRSCTVIRGISRLDLASLPPGRRQVLPYYHAPSGPRRTPSASMIHDAP